MTFNVCSVVEHGREHHGKIFVKSQRNWKTCAVRWDIFSLDLLATLSDYYMCGKAAHLEKLFVAISFICEPKGRAYFFSGCVRWGIVRGVPKNNVRAVTDAITQLWTDLINDYHNHGDEARRRPSRDMDRLESAFST